MCRQNGILLQILENDVLFGINQDMREEKQINKLAIMQTQGGFGFG